MFRRILLIKTHNLINCTGLDLTQCGIIQLHRNTRMSLRLVELYLSGTLNNSIENLAFRPDRLNLQDKQSVALKRLIRLVNVCRESRTEGNR